MSMTSSSRGRQLAVVLSLAIVSACRAAGSEPAPDSPRAAAAQQVAPKAEDDAAYRGPVELRSVRVRRLDATLQKMAGQEFMKRAKEPVAVEAQTAKALPTTPRDTSAILFINGVRMADTWMIQPDKLVAFVDRATLRPSNTAAAAWSGAEDTSRSSKPITFESTVQ
jgi:hypothetical protein